MSGGIRDPFWAWQRVQQDEWRRTAAARTWEAHQRGLPYPQFDASRKRFNLLQDVGELGAMDTTKLVNRLRARMLENPAQRVRLMRLLHAVENPPEDARLKPFHAAIVAAETQLAELDQYAADWRANGSHTEQGVQEMLKPKRDAVRARLEALRAEGIAPALNRLAAAFEPQIPAPAADEDKLLGWFAALSTTERVMAVHRAASGDDKPLAAALVRPENARYLSDPMSGKHKFLSPESTHALRSVFVQDMDSVEAVAQYAQFAAQHVDAALAALPDAS